MRTGRCRTSPQEPVERFQRVVAGVGAADVRSMFGAPPYFVGGTTAFGVHQEGFYTWLVAAGR